MDEGRVCEIVLDALRSANLARSADRQLPVGPEAPIFGAKSPLDSLGLVALLLDIEEALRAQGQEITLSDERAMSMAHSPFRDVPSLVAYIRQMTVVAA